MHIQAIEDSITSLRVALGPLLAHRRIPGALVARPCGVQLGGGALLDVPRLYCDEFYSSPDELSTVLFRLYG